MKIKNSLLLFAFALLFAFLFFGCLENEAPSQKPKESGDINAKEILGVTNKSAADSLKSLVKETQETFDFKYVYDAFTSGKTLACYKNETYNVKMNQFNIYAVTYIKEGKFRQIAVSTVADMTLKIDQITKEDRIYFSDKTYEYFTSEKNCSWFVMDLSKSNATTSTYLEQAKKYQIEAMNSNQTMDSQQYYDFDFCKGAQIDDKMFEVKGKVCEFSSPYNP